MSILRLFDLDRCPKCEQATGDLVSRIGRDYQLRCPACHNVFVVKDGDVGDAYRNDEYTTGLDDVMREDDYETECED